MDQSETCSRCNQGHFEFFCTCDSAAKLCEACSQSHFLSLLGVSHYLLPKAAYPAHLNDGFRDRLLTHITTKDKALSEVRKNLTLIETCQKELRTSVEELIAKIQEFYSLRMTELNAIKQELDTDVSQATADLDTWMYTDTPSVTHPLARCMAEYSQGAIPLFRYSVDVSPITSALSSLLSFQKLPLVLPSNPSEPLPTPPEISETTEEIISGYFCPVCKQNIRHKFHLKEHFNLHIKEYLYKCILCDCCFMRKNLFKAHIQVSHSGESVRKVMLKSQKIEPKSDQPLNLHCQICNTPIKSKDSLFEHAELHSEKYPCPLCPHTEVEFKLLEAHMKRHLKETKANYHCTICGNKYKNLSTVKKHVDSAHEGISIDAGFKETASNLTLACRFCGEKVMNLAQMVKHGEEHSRLGMEMRKKMKSIEEEDSKTESEDL